MAIKTEEGKWKCSYCNKEFSFDWEADNCRDSHELVLIQLTGNDLGRLQQFLVTQDEELLTDSLVNTINKAARNLARQKRV